MPVEAGCNGIQAWIPHRHKDVERLKRWLTEHSRIATLNETTPPTFLGDDPSRIDPAILHLCQKNRSLVPASNVTEFVLGVRTDCSDAAQLAEDSVAISTLIDLAMKVVSWIQQ